MWNHIQMWVPQENDASKDESAVLENHELPSLLHVPQQQTNMYFPKSEEKENTIWGATYFVKYNSIPVPFAHHRILTATIHLLLETK
jgi:hypothetical protein